MKNYRAVSTLPIFGKIFEKVIYVRLYNLFVSQGILHNSIINNLDLEKITPPLMLSITQSAK